MSELPFMAEVPVGLTRIEQWKQEHGVETWQWDGESSWNAEHTNQCFMATGNTESEACFNLAKKLNLPWNL